MAVIALEMPAARRLAGFRGSEVQDLGNNEDPDLRELHAYWLSKRGPRPMPSRADIDPIDIVRLLPNIFIVQVFRAPLRFRLRLVGTAICERWGENPTDRWLDGINVDGDREALLAQFAEVAEHGEPRLDLAEFATRLGRHLQYRRLLLPLADPSGTPNMILGSQKAVGIDGLRVDVDGYRGGRIGSKAPLPRWL